MFKIEFETSNAEFQNEDDTMNDFAARTECKRLLKRVLADFDKGYNVGALLDLNGNKVGEWKFEL